MKILSEKIKNGVATNMSLNKGYLRKNGNPTNWVREPVDHTSGVGMATSFGSVAVLTSNAGTADMLGDLLLSTGTVSVDNSGALDIGCKYDSFKYASVIGSCGLDGDLAQHCDGDNTIVGNRGVQTSQRQRARTALDLAFYHDANTILLNNPGKDEFSDIRDYDGAWWLASTAVLAFLIFLDVINSNRLFFLRALT
jgi:hypothetical protein